MVSKLLFQTLRIPRRTWRGHLTMLMGHNDTFYLTDIETQSLFNLRKFDTAVKDECLFPVREDV